MQISLIGHQEKPGIGYYGHKKRLSKRIIQSLMTSLVYVAQEVQQGSSSITVFPIPFVHGIW